MTGPTHGRYTSYSRGCRCAPCTDAHADRAVYDQQCRYARTAENGGIAPIAAHGYSTYINWGCACDVCRAGNRTHGQNQRAAAS